MCWVAPGDINLTAYAVTKDRDALDEMVKISGVRSVPVISACSAAMAGFEPNRLEQMLTGIKSRDRKYNEVVTREFTCSAYTLKDITPLKRYGILMIKNAWRISN